MTPPNGMVWAGIDTHTDTHTIALLDERGRPLGSETFAANPDGYDRLIDMLPGPGAVAAVGVEGTNSFGAALARRLAAAGYEVREVLRPKRNVRRRNGKSDPIDAVAAARSVMAVYGQINVYSVTTKSERYERSYWTRTAAGNGIGGRKAPVPYGS